MNKAVRKKSLSDNYFTNLSKLSDKGNIQYIVYRKYSPVYMAGLISMSPGANPPTIYAKSLTPQGVGLWWLSTVTQMVRNGGIYWTKGEMG